MGDNGNGEIRLSNNTIDNKATIVGAVSTVSPTKPAITSVVNAGCSYYFLKYLMLPHILLLYICGSYALMSGHSRSVKTGGNEDRT